MQHPTVSYFHHYEIRTYTGSTAFPFRSVLAFNLTDAKRKLRETVIGKPVEVINHIRTSQVLDASSRFVTTPKGARYGMLVGVEPEVRLILHNNVQVLDGKSRRPEQPFAPDHAPLERLQDALVVLSDHGTISFAHLEILADDLCYKAPCEFLVRQAVELFKKIPADPEAWATAISYLTDAVYWHGRDDEPLQGVEFFHVPDDYQPESDDPEQPYEDGWYYWYCQPGCLPDSEPVGPYDSEEDAILNCLESSE
jgi:hypothetical protein